MGFPLAFPSVGNDGAQAVLPASACAPCRPRCDVWSQRCGALRKFHQSGLYTVNHGEYMVIIWLMMVYNHRPMIPSGKHTKSY